jgi:amino acid transporter
MFILNRFINVATSAQLVTWIAMSITWLRWDAAMKAQGVSREILPYKSRIQPYGAYYALTVSRSWRLARGIGQTLIILPPQMSIIITFFNGYYVFLKGGWATADL